MTLGDFFLQPLICIQYFSVFSATGNMNVRKRVPDLSFCSKNTQKSKSAPKISLKYYKHLNMKLTQSACSSYIITVDNAIWMQVFL